MGAGSQTQAEADGSIDHGQVGKFQTFFEFQQGAVGYGVRGHRYLFYFSFIFDDQFMRRSWLVLC